MIISIIWVERYPKIKIKEKNMKIKKIVSVFTMFMVVLTVVTSLIPNNSSAAAIDSLSNNIANHQMLINEAKEQVVNQDHTPLVMPGKFNILYLVFRNVNVKNNDNTTTAWKMNSTTDKAYMDTCIASFKENVERLSKYNVKLNITTIYIDELINLNANVSMDPVTDYIKANYIDQMESIDSVIACYKGENSGGYTTSGIFPSYGYSCYRTALNSWDASFAPEGPDISIYDIGVPIHEWLHQLEGYRSYLGIDFPKTHGHLSTLYGGSEQYTGYQDYGANGSSRCTAYYLDFLGGTVLYNNDNLIGMYPKMWNVTPTSMEVGRYYIKNVATGNYLDYDSSVPITQETVAIQNSFVTGKKSQQWVLTASSNNGYVKIQPVANKSRYISEWGNNVKMWGYYNNDVHDWKFTMNSDGTYKISPKSNSNLALCLNNSTATATLAATSTNSNQKWELVEIPKIESGVSYTIKNAATGKYFDYTPSEQAVPLKQRDTFNTKSAQQWKINYTGNGLYKINPSTDSQKYISAINNDVEMWGWYATEYHDWEISLNSDGTFKISPYKRSSLAMTVTSSTENITLATYSFSDSTQKWILEEVPKVRSSTYRFKNLTSGKYLDYDFTVPISQETSVVQNTISSSKTSQQWNVTELENGFYRIKPVSDSARYLSAWYNPVMWGYYSYSPEQHDWLFIPNSDGTYSLSPAMYSSKVISIANTTGSTATLETYSASNKNQKWILEEVSPAIKEGVYYFKNLSSNKYLKNYNNTLNQSYLELTQKEYNYKLAENQQWRISSIGNGNFKICPVNDSTKFWTVSGNSIIIGSSSNSWKFVLNNDGTFKIQNSSKYLESTPSGTLSLNAASDTDNQKWTLVYLHE